MLVTLLAPIPLALIGAPVPLFIYLVTVAVVAVGLLIDRAATRKNDGAS